MTDLEISKALALAIGWSNNKVTTYKGICSVDPGLWDDWKIFDYRDWNVIGPIAERYDAFPLTSDSQPGVWFTRVRNQGFIEQFTYADTPQKAIALAVINGAKK